MEHSMSGGVIKKYETRTVAKVKTEEKEGWFFCSLPCFEGDRVRVEIGGKESVGEITEIRYNVTSELSPVPFFRMKDILGLEY